MKEKDDDGIVLIADVLPEVMEKIKHRVEHGCAPIAKEYPTRESVFLALSRAGIKKNSDDYRDYSGAKKLIFRGEFIDHNDYDRILGWIIDYTGV